MPKLIQVAHHNGKIREMGDRIAFPQVGPSYYVDGWRGAVAAHRESGCVMTFARDDRTGEVRRLIGRGQRL